MEQAVKDFIAEHNRLASRLNTAADKAQCLSKDAMLKEVSDDEDRLNLHLELFKINEETIPAIEDDLFCAKQAIEKMTASY